METNKHLKDVFIIKESQHNEKAQWVRVGIAFVNRDGSLNVLLDALPQNGKLHIRDRETQKSAS